MPTYLLAWNPSKWHWEDLSGAIETLHRDGYVDDEWSCGNRRNLPSGSRFFLIRLGQPPHGIVGAGRTLSEPAFGRHWAQGKRRAGAEARFVGVRFDSLSQEPIVAWSELKEAPFAALRWGIQASGVQIPAQIAAALEKRWLFRTTTLGGFLPEEIQEDDGYPEGGRRSVTVNAYERNARARADCVARYGAKCSVCGLMLEERYGPIAAGFIHVHHIVPLSEVDQAYQVNPTRDLRPVCPNCHAIIHRRQPALSIAQVRGLLTRLRKR